MQVLTAVRVKAIRLNVWASEHGPHIATVVLGVSVYATLIAFSWRFPTETSEWMSTIGYIAYALATIVAGLYAMNRIPDNLGLGCVLILMVANIGLFTAATQWFEDAYFICASIGWVTVACLIGKAVQFACSKIR